MRPEPLIIAKANLKSRIHRRVTMDYVGVKLYGENGRLAGELRLVGLFTSTAYTSSTAAFPISAARSRMCSPAPASRPPSHSGKALLNVLESYPRDELFQIDEETLFPFALAILALGERPRVRVLARRDKFDRFVSVIVFVPRDRYDSDSARAGSAPTWQRSSTGTSRPSTRPFRKARSPASISSSAAPAARRPIRARRRSRQRSRQSSARGATASRPPSRARHDPARAVRLGKRYGAAFPPAYRDDFPPETAVADIDGFERLTSERPIAGEFRPIEGGGQIGLRLSPPATTRSRSRRASRCSRTWASGSSMSAPTRSRRPRNGADLAARHDARSRPRCSTSPASAPSSSPASWRSGTASPRTTATTR